MTHAAANHLDAPAFVPPEPYKQPGTVFELSHLPRWLRVAIWIGLVAVEILSIWLFARK